MPQPPPNLFMVDASCCPSMQPLLDVQHLFASLVSKHRSLLLYEIIVLLISGYEIPTWFEQREYNYFNASPIFAIASILVDIPYVPDKREWLGIAVCFLFSHRNNSHIFWCFKAPEDKETSFRDCFIGDAYSDDPHLCIAFFPFNTQNCWRHLRGDRHQLELQIISRHGTDVKDCGWRLISKKDFDTCSAKYSRKRCRKEFEGGVPSSSTFVAEAQPRPAQRRKTH